MSVRYEELVEYADLILRGGVNLQRGQRLLVVGAPVEAPEIVNAIAEVAYRMGSPLVDPMWSSDRQLQIRLRNAVPDTFSEVSIWRARGRLEAAKRGDAVVTVLSSDPDLLRNEKPEYVADMVKADSRSDREYVGYRMSFRVAWTVVSVPTPGWARRVYPDMESDRATQRLWNDILGFCRVADGRSADAWQEHMNEIEARKRLMNERQYRELRFEGPGTELTVGLPDNQRWNGGQVATPSGVRFSPNIPTEEVFTMPHRDRVHGTVEATRPIHFNGLVIEELKLRIEAGAIVEAVATRGQEQIDKILSTDKGSRRLGEVALVSHDSPIARTGTTYFNGLIDENATSHLAIGQAYRNCVDGGASMSGEQFEAAGGNNSMNHIDFMVGSSDLDVYGIAPGGKVERVLKEGIWQL